MLVQTIFSIYNAPSRLKQLAKKSQSMIDLSVIIVLYSEYLLVQKTISSIYKNKVGKMEIIIVDNTENNKGHEVLIKKFPKIKYVHNKSNPGFAGGVNRGVKGALGQYILILTPDMYILPNTIKKTLEYLKNHSDVGMVGCRLYSKPGVQEPSANLSYPSLLTILSYYNMPFYKFMHRVDPNYSPNHYAKKMHKKILNTKWINGQYMLVRKKAFNNVKGFDARFFLYFEDVDFCKKLVSRNWRVVYLPVGGVVQNGLTEWKKGQKFTQALPPYMKSLYRYFKKHHGAGYVKIAWFVGTLSVFLSIPYLFAVLNFKKIFGLSTQSSTLLPLWIKIAKWHTHEGVREVF